jgi:hypothetical protein
MSLADFIPTLWSASLLEELKDDHVFVDVFNREYEGDIRGFGDSVRILTPERITVSSYTRNSTSITPQQPDGAAQALVIDQANYFSFEIDDLDKAQQNPKLMQAFMREAAWSMSDTIDADLATELWAGLQGNATANTGNRLSDRTVGTGASDDDAWEMLIDLGIKLDEDNVPQGGRFCVVPPWFMGVLSKDPRASSFGTDKNRATFANGRVSDQMVAGFDLRVSNNVTVNGSAYRIVAGYKGAATYAEQLESVEAFRPEDSFHDAVKGLHLYGRKITRPNALAGVEATAA